MKKARPKGSVGIVTVVDIAAWRLPAGTTGYISHMVGDCACVKLDDGKHVFLERAEYKLTGRNRPADVQPEMGL